MNLAPRINRLGVAAVGAPGRSRATQGAVPERVNHPGIEGGRPVSSISGAHARSEKTLAELSAAELNTRSHRGAAARRLLAWLREHPLSRDGGTASGGVDWPRSVRYTRPRSIAARVSSARECTFSLR